MDTDPDPEGPKTCGSGGSGSGFTGTSSDDSMSGEKLVLYVNKTFGLWEKFRKTLFEKTNGAELVSPVSRTMTIVTSN